MRGLLSGRHALKGECQHVEKTEYALRIAQFFDTQGHRCLIDPRLAVVEEDVGTLGGLAFMLAEAVPGVGAMLLHPSGWTLEVIAGDEKRVTRLRLHPAPQAAASED